MIKHKPLVLYSEKSTLWNHSMEILLLSVLRLRNTGEIHLLVNFRKMCSLRGAVNFELIHNYPEWVRYGISR